MIRQLLTPVVAGLVAGKALSFYLNHKAEEKKKIKRKAHRDQKVDVAAEDSFPASDPPAWNYVHSVGTPKQTA